MRRADVPEKDRYSLSPLTYMGMKAGTRIVLLSPNGATYSHVGQRASSLLIAALVNAQAAATAISQLLSNTELFLSVIACGEQEGA